LARDEVKIPMLRPKHSRLAALLIVIAGSTQLVLASALAVPRAESGVPAESSQARLSAAYVDGTLTMRTAGPSGPVEAVARWTVEPVPVGSHVYRVARLDLPDPDTQKDPTPGNALPLQVLGPALWNEVVREVMTGLAPAGEQEAALTLVQGEEIVFHLTAERRLQVYRLVTKPAALHVTKFVGEGEFAAHAEAVLRARYPGSDVLLFQTSDDPQDVAFVLFDLPRRQSVLVVGPLVGERGPLPNLLHVVVRVPGTLLVRGQALGLLTRPVSSVGRLAWLVTQSTLKLIPPHYDEPGTPPPPVVERPGMDLAAWERELDAMNLPPNYRGTIEPLIDGEAFFTRLVQAIQDAQKSIDVRLFIFDNDDYAMKIADLLRRRSREVRVRVLIDAMGTLGAGQAAPEGAATGSKQFSIVRYLREDSAIDVRENPNPLLVADHTKSILVDRRLAFLGGMNIGHEYRHDWHDMMVELTGPIVGRLRYDFDVAWAYAGFGGDLAYLKALGGEERFAGEDERADYVNLRPLYTRTLDPQVLRAQLAAIRRARRLIWIEQPYVSDDTLIGALIEARARGVDVRMIVPTRGDSRFMNSANLLAASVLTRNGVRVYVYPGMTHVKAALYDGWACLGSANFDKLSLRVNREANVATADPAFVERLRRELFEVDFARSREIGEPPTAGWGTYITAYVAGQL
jgi:cardiolipin synthase